MDIKLPDIKKLKMAEKNFVATLFGHIKIVWIIFGAILILYAGYLFYFQIYITLTTNPAPFVQIPTVQKNQLNTALDNIRQKDQRKGEFNPKAIINPFEIKL